MNDQLFQEGLSRAAMEEAAFRALEQTGALFWVKDSQRVFVRCTQAFAVMMGYRSPEQILGKRDEDVSPEYLVSHYRSYDEQVLETGEPISDLVELVRSVDGSYDWCVTSKWAIHEGGEIVGVAGLTGNPHTRERAKPREFVLAPAVEMIARGYAEQLRVADLAAACGMSEAHFNRRFKAHFHATPYRYLRQVRMMAVADLLSTTDLSLAQVAHQTGHYDQSHLANEFMKARGMTPSKYRLKMRAG